MRDWQNDRCGSAASSCSGFTLVELIVTLILVGILAIAVVPRFASVDAFRTRGFSDQVRSALEYARQQAIAQRRTVCVSITSSALTLTQAPTNGGACSNPVKNPATNGNYTVSAPSGITFGSALSFSFNALGQPSPNTAKTVQINGDSVTTFTVEAETGYVH